MGDHDLLFLILGIVIPFIIQFTIFPFLPKSVQGFAMYQKKKIMKIIRQSEVNTELVVKTERYVGDATVDEAITIIQKKIGGIFKIRNESRNLIVDVPIGTNTIQVTIIPIHRVDNEVLKFESLECRFTAKCRFHKFNACVRDFREAQRKIEDILHDTITPHFKTDLALICKLKSLYEITDILKGTNFESMSAELDNGKQFEISKNGITIYDKDINDDVISLAEKMIVVYG